MSKGTIGGERRAHGHASGEIGAIASSVVPRPPDAEIDAGIRPVAIGVILSSGYASTTQLRRGMCGLRVGAGRDLPRKATDGVRA
ncbi:MAG: hypothetical protein ABI330_05075 [Caldimonas sp.]